MGNSAQMKSLRKQLRNVVKEILPEIFTNELKTAAYQDVQVAVKKQLTGIETQITKTLKKMDERQKDVQDFLVRQISSNPVADAGDAPIVEAKSE